MDDPLDLLDVEDTRPAKRLKMPSASSKSRYYSADAKVFWEHQTLYQPLQAQLHAQSLPSHFVQEQAQSFASQTPSQSPSMAMTAADPAVGESTNTIVWPGCAPVFDSSWAWPTSAQETHASTTHFIAPRESVEADILSTAILPLQHTLPANVDAIGNTPSPVHPALLVVSRRRNDKPLVQNLILIAGTSTGVNHDSPPSYQPDTIYLDHFDPVNGPAPTKTFPRGGPTSANPTISHRQQINAHTPFSSNQFIESPFRDCIGTFGLSRSHSFRRPVDGQVNGYIKFSWPKEHDKKRKLSARTSSTSQTSRITELDDDSEPHNSPTSSNCVVVRGPSGTPPAVTDVMPDLSIDFSTYAGQTADMKYDMLPASGSTPPSVLHDTVGEVASLGAPQLIPSQYGYEAKMDSTDRRFWMFFLPSLGNHTVANIISDMLTHTKSDIRNWCPGRSVLEETNLWLKDFAQMHKSVGVRSAIQSLAGIYIYDYQPLESIRERVNRRFEDAERRFSQLLNDPATYRDESRANELITIGVILSMQDIVLTERRLKKPFTPRWLQGFRRAEEVLQATDHGFRFWRTSNVQTSALRISQSVIVGRAVILAQPMFPLPSPDEFDATKEASRFGWLLYGTERDMYQIHGGCGFSKKLLHILSQVTYCAARLRQDAESPVVPVTADYIRQELVNMRQWSPESRDWEVVMNSAAVIEYVRRQPPGYKIDENSTMTDVTAEAWRIASILYLLCRVFRSVQPGTEPDKTLISQATSKPPGHSLQYG
ncbi:hypothetical protein E4U43_003859 [Claviceps pusilla]|uniref:Transcription factor domain-containing protein n=1 Tax=Claviceps pusilla TaxID=123648 RepID=A0A9P7N4Z1_9HYPO|nr:hypothetical protein E4U43_003859 [Claviceps pusilla]